MRMDPVFYHEPNNDPDGGLTEEELAEWDEITARMDACPVKSKHLEVEEDGCLECGYGAK